MRKKILQKITKNKNVHTLNIIKTAQLVALTARLIRQGGTGALPAGDDPNKLSLGSRKKTAFLRSG